VEIMKLANLLLVAGAAVAALPLTTSRAAADGIPGVVMTDSQFLTDWSGVYVGGKLGGAWGNSDWHQTNASDFDPAGVIGNATLSSSGFIGGVFGGANLQLGQWIFGAELSYSGMTLSSSQASQFFPATDTFSTELNSLGTVEGRVGYSWDRVMIFGKGGWAGGGVKLTMNRTAGLSASNKDTFVDGFVLGAGLDYAIWKSVLIGLEYDFVDLNLNSETLVCGACVVQPAVDNDIKISAVMLRMSYLFAAED
jgi:outer membrane immunogenic protein